MSIALTASVPVTNRRRWWIPAGAWGGSTVIVNIAVPGIRRLHDSSGDASSHKDAVTQSRSTQRMAGGVHAVKYFSDISPASWQCSGQQRASIGSLVVSDRTPQIMAETERSRCRAPIEPPRTGIQGHYVSERKYRAMIHALFRPLFSARTLVRVAFAALSLHSMGTAFGQGLAAGTTAPVYGTTWAAARALSRIQDAPVLASRQPKDGQAGASATPHDKLHPSSRRTGG